MRLLVPCSIALALVIALIISAIHNSNERERYTFKGEPAFQQQAEQLPLTLDQARQHLLAELQRTGKTYTPFPEEIILIHDRGYLFLNGEFKLNIQIKGYHVDPQGHVHQIDLQDSIPVKSYMKQINRTGWNTPSPQP